MVPGLPQQEEKADSLEVSPDFPMQGMVPMGTHTYTQAHMHAHTKHIDVIETFKTKNHLVAIKS